MKHNFLVACIMGFIGTVLPASGNLARGQEQSSDSGGQSHSRARYVFLFIGDGMGPAQYALGDYYMDAISQSDSTNNTHVHQGLTMSRFPVAGFTRTHSADSVVTDSAAAGTAIACGQKTDNGVLGMDSSRTRELTTIAELAKADGMKVGLVTSVGIDHATPASFYSHRPSREMYYQIALDLIASDVDYAAGGGFNEPQGPTDNSDAMSSSEYGSSDTAGSMPNIYTLLEHHDAITLVRTRDALRALKPGCGRVAAINHTLSEGGSLYYEIDRPDDHISLSEFTEKGIELLDNPNGFFMMVEGGKIDWACHANAPAATVHDVLAFDRAIEKAYRFYQKHPNETLIVVTADHECGGMTLGLSKNSKNVYAELLARPRGSYLTFKQQIDTMCSADDTEAVTFEKVCELIENFYGMKHYDKDVMEELARQAAAGDPDARTSLRLALNEHDMRRLTQAYDIHMGTASADDLQPRQWVLAGKLGAITAATVEIFSGKAGLGWTSHTHTAVPVPVFAVGAGQQLFAGVMDNTQLHHRLCKAIGLPGHTHAPAAR